MFSRMLNLARRPLGPVRPWPENAGEVDRLLRSAASATGPERRDLLEQAVIAALPLALRAAEQYRQVSDRAELSQIAALALVKAARSYLQDTRGGFALHAAPIVHSEIRRNLQKRSTAPSWAEVLPALADAPATARQILALNLVGGLHASRIALDLGLPQAYVARVISTAGGPGPEPAA